MLSLRLIYAYVTPTDRLLLLPLNPCVWATTVCEGGFGLGIFSWTGTMCPTPIVKFMTILLSPFGPWGTNVLGTKHACRADTRYGSYERPTARLIRRIVNGSFLDLQNISLAQGGERLILKLNGWSLLKWPGIHSSLRGRVESLPASTGRGLCMKTKHGSNARESKHSKFLHFTIFVYVCLNKLYFILIPCVVLYGINIIFMLDTLLVRPYLWFGPRGSS